MSTITRPDPVRFQAPDPAPQAEILTITPPQEASVKLSSHNLDHISTEKVLVTPALAEHYLEVMHANRAPSKLGEDTMAALLREDEFYGGISPVYFDARDIPWDGLHRFRAIRDTGIAAPMLFIRGVTEHESGYIDTGRRRTFYDYLKITGVPQAKRRSELTRLLALYAKYGIDGIRVPGALVITPAEKEAFLEAPGITEAIRAGEALGRQIGVNSTYAAYAIYQTRGADGAVDPDGFWESVRSGVGFQRDDDPGNTMRNYFTKPNKSGRHPADPRLMTLYILGTGWNKHVTGDKWSRPSPRFDDRPNGQRYLPATQVPDFLSLAAREKHIGALRTAHTRLEEARTAAQGNRSGHAPESRFGPDSRA